MLCTKVLISLCFYFGQLRCLPAVPTITLRNGVQMPLIFTGTWLYNNSEVHDMLKTYLSREIGGVGIDTSDNYRNLLGVGEALAGLPRSEYFLQTKIDGCRTLDASQCTQKTRRDLQASLDQLHLDHVDSIMLHYPPLLAGTTCSSNPLNCSVSSDTYTATCAGIVAQWRVLVAFYQLGKARSIGVSNYCKDCLTCLEHETVFPMFNQVEYYLGMGYDNHKVLSIGKKYGMHIQAYSVTGNKWYDKMAQSPARDIANGTLTTTIAQAHGRTPVQVALKWLVDLNISIMVKSMNPQHMKENLDLFSWTFSAREMQQLNDHIMPIPPNPVDCCQATGNHSLICSTPSSREGRMFALSTMLLDIPQSPPLLPFLFMLPPLLCFLFFSLRKFGSKIHSTA
eukprot:TRINITY_DN46926_c0_g1_i1.p1 TRINITY_DN46926_c0_g1~~TRINITY_DN46926_c0_g1_i1.p1  ORF type:complete len:396 (+),score=42.73 TRINITY_DN46926_c0_g1_i1:82-1269(+)